VSQYQLEYFGLIGRPNIYKATKMEMNRLSLSLYIYIYMCVCVCVCVCLFVCLRVCINRRTTGRVKTSHFSVISRPALGPIHPPWVTWALSPWVKKSGREADQVR
jgi:hypothetical protein